MKVVFIGDIVGNIGRETLKRVLPWIQEKYHPHLIVANGENAAGGRGINAAITHDLLQWGIHCITMGNHTWDNREIFEFIEKEPHLVRPANLGLQVPGRGYTVVKANGKTLGVVNLIGRTFLPPSDCPFRTGNDILQSLRKQTKNILVDFHAEATSEKIAMGFHLDGLASVVVGTHTHVQTNDAHILPGGTAYLTDAGMTGPRDGILGMNKETVIRRFVTGMPGRFTVAEGKWMLNGLFIEIEEATGKAVTVQTIQLDEDSWIAV